jgi:hypothetical protein
MTGPWQYQLRIYLTDEMAALARTDPSSPALRALMDVLARHDAKPVSQFDAFAAYVREAEREGVAQYPLYRWTKATIEDPAKQARHAGTFSLHVGGQEVYPKAAADALEAALQPLIGGGVVTRMSRHDTNPANNLQVPAEYRS